MLVLKQQLGLTQPLGYSRGAVWLTILIAVSIAVLLLLLATERPAIGSRLAWALRLALSLLASLRLNSS